MPSVTMVKTKPRLLLDFVELMDVNSVKKQNCKGRKGPCSVPANLHGSIYLLNFINVSACHYPLVRKVGTKDWM